jgi:hypothetical protein
MYCSVFLDYVPPPLSAGSRLALLEILLFITTGNLTPDHSMSSAVHYSDLS